MQSIPDGSSLFIADIKTVDLALGFIRTCDIKIILLYFLTRFQFHTSSKNPQIQKLLEKCHELLVYKNVFSDQIIVI